MAFWSSGSSMLSWEFADCHMKRDSGEGLRVFDIDEKSRDGIL